MGLFDKVQRLNSDSHQKLLRFYEQSDLFPIEVRNIVAPLIETSLCGTLLLDFDNPNHLANISAFIKGVVQGLENQLQKEEENNLPFFLKHKLTTALQHLQTEGEAVAIFRRIKECLAFEKELVSRAEAEAVVLVMEQPGTDILMDNLAYVRKRVEGTGELLKGMMGEQAAFEILLTEKQHLEDHLNSVQNMNPDEQTANLELSVRQGIEQKASAVDASLLKMMTLRNSFFQEIRTNIKNISELQQQILRDKLFVWKFQQQKAANGLSALNPLTLEKVQLYLEHLAELIWRARQQVQETERLKPRNPVFNDPLCETSMLLEDLLVLLTTLLNEAFVVEDQPQQVMKKGNRFTNAPKVSLLVGNLNIQMSNPQVSTCIIREVHARNLSVVEKVEDAMPITNGNSTLELNTTLRRLTAKFSNLHLKEIKRADRRSNNTGSSSESVMEEKLCMLFEVKNMVVGDLRVRIRTLSLPVVVTSHGSQDPTAEATIMWDNAFGQMGRVPFVVPNRVPWAELAQVISAKFFTTTGRPLSEDNLRFLKNKAFRGASHSDYITWAEFCKDNLTNYSFSFWHWVYQALKNIERKDAHLKDLWKEGHLAGFVEREGAASMLSFREPGTFMLRFSDSKPGAITISVVNEEREVICIAPMDENELKQKRLANSIRDLEQLKYLYPDIPKDDAFSKYYSVVDIIPNPDKPYVNILPSIPDGRRRSSGSVQQVGTPTSPGQANPLDNQLLMSPQGNEFYGGSNPGSPMMSLRELPVPMNDYNFPVFVSLTPTALLPPMEVLTNHPPFQRLESLEELDALMMNEMNDFVDNHEDLINVNPIVSMDQGSTWTHI